VTPESFHGFVDAKGIGEPVKDNDGQ
jgi:hypothetical protein